MLLVEMIPYAEQKFRSIFDSIEGETIRFRQSELETIISKNLKDLNDYLYEDKKDFTLQEMMSELKDLKWISYSSLEDDLGGFVTINIVFMIENWYAKIERKEGVATPLDMDFLEGFINDIVVKWFDNMNGLMKEKRKLLQYFDFGDIAGLRSRFKLLNVVREQQRVLRPFEFIPIENVHSKIYQIGVRWEISFLAVWLKQYQSIQDKKDWMTTWYEIDDLMLKNYVEFMQNKIHLDSDLYVVFIDVIGRLWQKKMRLKILSKEDEEQILKHIILEEKNVEDTLVFIENMSMERIDKYVRTEEVNYYLLFRVVEKISKSDSDSTVMFEEYYTRLIEKLNCNDLYFYEILEWSKEQLDKGSHISDIVNKNYLSLVLKIKDLKFENQHAFEILMLYGSITFLRNKMIRRYWLN